LLLSPRKILQFVSGFDVETQTLRIELCIWTCRRWQPHRLF